MKGMITECVLDVSSWKSWQQEYRFGVLLIIPPDPPLSQINTLRSRYAWSQSSKCPAHISLTVPLPHGITQAEWEELQSIASGVQPFTIRYGPLRHYLPHPGVCLRIEPEPDLDRLRTALEAASCFASAPPRRYPFSPHMTIAEMISVEQTEAITRELTDEAPQGTFACTSVSYAVPDSQFRLMERARLNLGL